MLIIILSAVMPCLLAILFVLQRKGGRFWADRGIPHSSPHPLVGNLDVLWGFKKNFGVWMRDLHAKYSAPFVGIWVFRQPVLVVADPEVARRILMSDSDQFRNRYLASGKSDPMGGLNIFTVKEPIWSNVRRRITYIFTAAKLKSMHSLLSTKSKATVIRIRQDLEKKKRTEIRNLFADYSTDIIGTFAFGIENNAVVSGDSPIRAVTRDFMEYNWFRGLSWYSVFFWPALVDIFGFSLFPKKTTSFFRKTFNMIIEQRMASKIESNDLIDALLKLKNEKLDDGQEFSDDLLTSQAVIMLQGGFDTTAVASTFIVYELAYNPEVQEKLHKEITEAKQKKDGDDLSFNDLEKLTYLNAVINEGLRKYPPMGWLDRLPAVDYKINDSLTISAGTPVYINAIGMHYDPQFFPEPYEFNPNRFLPENAHNIVPFSYMPFGDGPRMCIGKRFAQMTLRYLISEVIHNLKFKPLPGSPKPRDVSFETKGLFLMPNEPLAVEFIPRN